MRLKDLSEDQRLQLKQKIIDSRCYETEKRSASYGELAAADSLVTDEELEREYGDTCFVEEDFFG